MGQNYKKRALWMRSGIFVERGSFGDKSAYVSGKKRQFVHKLEENF